MAAEVRRELELLETQRSLAYKIGLTIVIVGPALSVPIAIYRLVKRIDGPKEVAMCLGVYAPIAMLGVTGGLHRIFTHRSGVPKRWLKIVHAVSALASIEGKIVRWVADHIWHHLKSDTPEDLHSPWKFYDRSKPWYKQVKAILRGFWHAHIGWLYLGKKAPPVLADHITDDPDLVMLDRWYPVIVAASIFLPLLFGWKAFLWAGLVRIFLVHHATWSINSVMHMIPGHKSFRNVLKDMSRAVSWWLLTLGEQWHDKHHAMEWSAQMGPIIENARLKWVEYALDPTFGMLRFCERRGWHERPLKVATKAQCDFWRYKEEEASAK